MRLLLAAFFFASIAAPIYAQPLAEVGHYGENISTVAVDGTLASATADTSADLQLTISPLSVPALLAEPSRWNQLVVETGDAQDRADEQVHEPHDRVDQPQHRRQDEGGRIFLGSAGLGGERRCHGSAIARFSRSSTARPPLTPGNFIAGLRFPA